MNHAIEAIQAIGSPGLTGSNSITAQAAPGFTEVFAAQLQRVDGDMHSAELALQKLAAGESIELHDVMIALETARIGVQTVIQVRNRLVEAYQDVMRMQV
jgi:flagellar hook-basal body complex protein FliE